MAPLPSSRRSISGLGQEYKVLSRFLAQPLPSCRVVVELGGGGGNEKNGGDVFFPGVPNGRV